MAQRYQHVEHAILTLVLEYGDHQGYANTLGGLANILRQTLPDIATREIIDTLKRLEPRYVTLWKYGSAFARLVQYSGGEIDDEYLFGQGDFCIQRTPETDPRVQELALAIHPREVSMTSTISEEGRKQRFARWKEMGLDRVKADLVHNGGRNIGSGEVQDLAWEWVHINEAEIAAAPKRRATPEVPFIAETRLEGLRGLSSARFNFSRLIRLCEEINIAYGEGCYFATAMLTRALLDHVPPLFGKANFDEVADHYGGRSVKETLWHLNSASKSIADGLLHEQIGKRASLPTAQQVDCRQQLDVLLGEVEKVG